MADPQTIANEIGVALRAAESSADTEGALATRAALTQLHAKLTRAYVFLRDETDGELSELDWDAIAGNHTDKVGGAQTQGGGAKDHPPSNQE